MSNLQKEVLGSIEDNKERVKLWIEYLSKVDLQNLVQVCGKCNVPMDIYKRFDGSPVYAICEGCGKIILSNDFTEEDYIYM